MNPAQSARLAKEKHPERYCADKRCLFRVFPDKPCPKHPAPKPAECERCGVALGLGLHMVERAKGMESCCKDCAEFYFGNAGEFDYAELA